MADITIDEALRSRKKFKMFFKRGDVLWKAPYPNQPGRYYTIQMYNPLARTTGATLPDPSIVPILEAMNISIRRRRDGRPIAVGLNTSDFVNEERYLATQIHPLSIEFVSRSPNELFLNVLKKDPMDNVSMILNRALIPYDLQAPDFDDTAFTTIEFIG